MTRCGATNEKVTLFRGAQLIDFGAGERNRTSDLLITKHMGE